MSSLADKERRNINGTNHTKNVKYVRTKRASLVFSDSEVKATRWWTINKIQFKMKLNEVKLNAGYVARS